jgi:hypothetical protein
MRARIALALAIRVYQYVINANSVVILFQRNEDTIGQVVEKYAQRNPARVP